MRNIKKYLILPITIIWAAIDLINFFDDLFPALIKWIEFFQISFDHLAEIRDFLMLPLIFPLKEILNITIPSHLRSYIFIGFLLQNTYNYSHLVICGFPSNCSYWTLLIPIGWFKSFGRILYRILFWPSFFIELVIFYLNKEYREKHHVMILWGKVLIAILSIAIFLVITNWGVLRYFKFIEGS